MKVPHLLAIASTFVLPLSASISAPSNDLGNSVQIEKDVVMGTGGGRPLHANLVFPKSPSSTPMPAVIYTHGGGWKNGSYQNNPYAYLAQHGYFTASIEYRLSAEAKWPAQIEDCKLAGKVGSVQMPRNTM